MSQQHASGLAAAIRGSTGKEIDGVLFGCFVYLEKSGIFGVCVCLCRDLTIYYIPFTRISRF